MDVGNGVFVGKGVRVDVGEGNGVFVGEGMMVDVDEGNGVVVGNGVGVPSVPNWTSSTACSSMPLGATPV